MRRVAVALTTLLIAAVLALGVAQPAARAQQVEEWTIGVVLPFTGSLGEFGKGFLEGINLAVEEMNAKLEMVGRPLRFRVVSQDTLGTPDGAAKALQTVAQTAGVQVVIGPLSTSEVLGAKQFADQNKIVIIAPASSGLAAAIPNDYIFRVMNPPDSFSAQAFEGIAIARGYKNVVILNVDDPFGNGLAAKFTDRFKAAGGAEVSAIKFPRDAADLSSEVTQVSAEIARLSGSGSTAFFCICFLGDAQKVLKLAVVDANMGSVEWMGIENLYRPEMLANPDEAQLLGSVKFTVVSTSSRATPNTQPFLDAFEAKYGKKPGPFTNYAYDAAYIAMHSMLFAGNNGEAVQKIVPFIAGRYIGTQVQTALDENGDQAVAFLSIYRVKEDGSGFEEIGSYDGSSGQVTFK